MAFAAAARRSLGSRISDHLTRRLHPALPHLLTPNSSGDPPNHSPLRPLSRLQSPHLPLQWLHQYSGTAKTLTLFPLGIHLTGPPRQGFSSSSPSSPTSRSVDVGAVLTDAADAAAPVAAGPVSFPSEVAWAAEDSSLSTAAVQHLIDAVHSFTGLNWWLSIALSTLLLRCMLFPLSVKTMKTLIGMKQEVLAVAKLVESVNDNKSAKEASRRQNYIFKRLGLPAFVIVLTPYTFMTLYFAISNMVEKVPSLKEGGAFWFTDLTTPDALYIFPIITSLFFMLKLESNHRYHYSKTTRSSDKLVRIRVIFFRILFLLTLPVTASLPQAISCYLVTWSFTSLVHSIVMKQPAVKKLLYGDLVKPTCPSSDGPKKPTAEDSPCLTEEHEQRPHPSERIRSSDASVHRVRNHSDKK